MVRLAVGFVLVGSATPLAMLVNSPAAFASTTGTCSESGTTTVTVTCTVGSGTWTPPGGVTSVSVDVEGGAGGAGTSAPGGFGGKATATLAVSSANTYTVLVGGAGGAGGSGAGGTNGGGSGGLGGGGGGGSEIDLSATRLVVAGGGGGGGGWTQVVSRFGSGTGGDGGGTSGQGGAGGAGIDGGAGGQPGTDTGPGSFGAAGCSLGAAGQSGSGSSGGAGGQAGAGGGGGGGGFFGGGGGGAGCFGDGGAGGGGGSGHLDTTTSTVSGGTMTLGGGPSGDGSVTITYTVKPSDAALHISHLTFPEDERQAAVKVTFIDDDPGGRLSQYSGTINWGDGSTSSIPKKSFFQVSKRNGGGFGLYASHTYAKVASYSVQVTLNDVGGARVNSSAQLVVERAAD